VRGPLGMYQERAVFLDRDGVVNRERGYISRPEQLEIYPFARSAIASLKAAGWMVIIVTNQSGVSRRILSEADLQVIHQQLLDVLGVDAIYHCPHLPDEQCVCRKPAPGLIFRAARDYQIDLGRSYLVGDRASDILAGKRAGLSTVLVRTGYGSTKMEQAQAPDRVCDDLGRFVDCLTRPESGYPFRCSVLAGCTGADAILAF